MKIRNDIKIESIDRVQASGHSNRVHIKWNNCFVNKSDCLSSRMSILVNYLEPPVVLCACFLFQFVQHCILHAFSHNSLFTYSVKPVGWFALVYVINLLCIIMDGNPFEYVINLLRASPLSYQSAFLRRLKPHSLTLQLFYLHCELPRNNTLERVICEEQFQMKKRNFSIIFPSIR